MLFVWKDKDIQSSLRYVRISHSSNAGCNCRFLHCECDWLVSSSSFSINSLSSLRFECSQRLPWNWNRMGNSCNRPCIQRNGLQVSIFSLLINLTIHPFRVQAGSLAFSVTLFIIGSVICIALLQFRRFPLVSTHNNECSICRFNRKVGGELGGPMGCKITSVLVCSFFPFLNRWNLFADLLLSMAYVPSSLNSRSILYHQILMSFQSH